jgi:hypothetical protein
MGIKDLFVTPIFALLILFAAYVVRPYLTDFQTKKYFIPALLLKLFGAVMLGVIYQFYYGGGDTFNYHTHGSIHIWEAFLDSPFKGIQLLFATGQHEPETYFYSRDIWYFRDQASYFVVRVAAFFDLFTGATYSATALFFALFSFSGTWMLFKTFYREFPHLHWQFALAILFVPSVFFWGSGILKDTLTLGALGWITYCIHRIFIRKDGLVVYSIIAFGMFLLIFLIKKYIIICLLPALIIWVFANFTARNIKSMLLKVVLIPPLALPVLGFGFFAVTKIVEEDRRYSLDKIAETARITAYDIRYGWGKDGGSGYSLGEMDGTFTGMVKLFPAAVNVSLFRPYLWEVNNPLMLISALESTLIFLVTIYIFLKAGTRHIFRYAFKPTVLFSLAFSITFAFAVGVSTYNFGTLVRYKIPMMPFYLISLILVHEYVRAQKAEKLEITS